MTAFKVLIIGAGLAGSLLANGLELRGIDYVLYESDIRAEDATTAEGAEDAKSGRNRAGYQIRLGAYALAGFRACLTKERFDSCIGLFGRSGGVISSAPTVYNIKFDKVLLDLSKFPAYTKSAPINRVVLRDFLQEPIHQTRKLQYGKKFVKYEIIDGPSANGSRVRAHFDDGTTDEGDVLVSAEGAVSKVNSQVGLDNIVPLTSDIGFLAKGNLPTTKMAMLPPEIRKGPVTTMNQGMMLYSSAYLPPPKRGNSDENTEQYDEEMASIFCAVTMPVERLPPGGAEAIKDRKEFCLQQISHWGPKFHQIFHAAEDEVHILNARASRQPPKNWRKKVTSTVDAGRGHGRIWLMGDAIHPMLPGRGMGGNQAMCDAADLLKELAPLAERAKSGQAATDSDVETAVLAYEHRMIPRAFEWVKKSGGLGDKPSEPESFMGRIVLFTISRFLDLAYVWTLIRMRVFGYKPHDDAPELPD